MLVNIKKIRSVLSKGIPLCRSILVTVLEIDHVIASLEVDIDFKIMLRCQKRRKVPDNKNGSIKRRSLPHEESLKCLKCLPEGRG